MTAWAWLTFGSALESKETGLEAEIHKILLVIPNIIDPSVPIGPDDMTPSTTFPWIMKGGMQ